MKTYPPVLVISEILGKGSAILHSDGLIVYEKLSALEDQEIVLSFIGITHCTTAFLNASIGKFIIDNKGNDRLIRFIQASEDILGQIELVQDNARNEKKRTSLENSARGFLYA